ncbi:MAG: AAA family ATPase [Erysipelotrichaceae bacterium]|nr:AAA family ATPase [Erysipelotrichaceae bacterium]
MLSQTELLNKTYSAENNYLFGGLLRPGLYVLAGTSKVGKSIMATTIANAVAKGEDFLGQVMPQGKVLYFDNDNYDYEAKGRLVALNLLENDDIFYEFDKSKSIDDIKYVLYSIKDIKNYRLVIIDSYIGLKEVTDSDDSYQDLYPIIKELRDYIVKKNLVGIIIHHTKKGKERMDQDNLLGSRALSGATTGTLLLSVRNEFDRHGELKLILRNKKTVFKIKKDENDINWLLDDDESETTEVIPKNILFLINTVVCEENHKLIGTCQELVQKTRMELNPNFLYKYLKANKKYLDENNVTFDRDRKKGQRIIIIEYHDDSVTDESGA